MGNGSGKNLGLYFDEETKEKYIPHCIEPSLGVDRLMLAVICSAYAEDEVGGEKRNFLKFSPRIAPIKAVVLPLLKTRRPSFRSHEISMKSCSNAATTSCTMPPVRSDGGIAAPTRWAFRSPSPSTSKPSRTMP